MSVICREGLFRVSGRLSRIAELRTALCSGTTVDLSPYSPHDVAQVGDSFHERACMYTLQILKALLNELPSPLCTEEHLPVYIAAAGAYNFPSTLSALSHAQTSNAQSHCRIVVRRQRIRDVCRRCVCSCCCCPLSIDNCSRSCCNCCIRSPCMRVRTR